MTTSTPHPLFYLKLALNVLTCTGRDVKPCTVVANHFLCDLRLLKMTICVSPLMKVKRSFKAWWDFGMSSFFHQCLSPPRSMLRVCLLTCTLPDFWELISQRCYPRSLFLLRQTHSVDITMSFRSQQSLYLFLSDRDINSFDFVNRKCSKSIVSHLLFIISSFFICSTSFKLHVFEWMKRNQYNCLEWLTKTFLRNVFIWIYNTLWCWMWWMSNLTNGH